MRGYLIVFLVIVGLTGCKVKPSAREGKPVLVCSTSIIADCMREITGDDFEVIALMGPGIDPHAYNPRPTDIERLQQADVILYNGFHLEGKMAALFADLSKRSAVIALADHFPDKQRIVVDPATQTIDPHIWFATTDWLNALEGATNDLAKRFPETADQLKKRFAAYREEVEAVAKKGKQALERIPQQQRVLITSHDAFHYFGREYGVKVKALQGVSTTQEPGVKDVMELVDFITENNIKSVFIEHSVSPKSLQAVRESCKSKGHTITVGGTLYSDALGEPGGKAGSYTGMLNENISTICKGLQ